MKYLSSILCFQSNNTIRPCCCAELLLYRQTTVLNVYFGNKDINHILPIAKEAFLQINWMYSGVLPCSCCNSILNSLSSHLGLSWATHQVRGVLGGALPYPFLHHLNSLPISHGPLPLPPLPLCSCPSLALPPLFIFLLNKIPFSYTGVLSFTSTRRLSSAP